MLTSKVLRILDMLLKDGEYFVSLSIKRNTTTLPYLEESWKECVTQSLGELLNQYKYTFNLTALKGETITNHTAKLEGHVFINHFWDMIKDSDAIRVTISPQNGRHSIYIVIR